MGLVTKALKEEYEENRADEWVFTLVSEKDVRFCLCLEQVRENKAHVGPERPDVVVRETSRKSHLRRPPDQQSNCEGLSETVFHSQAGGGGWCQELREQTQPPGSEGRSEGHDSRAGAPPTSGQRLPALPRAPGDPAREHPCPPMA